MSLLALLVGTLLIYGAVSFAVLQRRRIIGVLRALGATRARGARHRARRSGAARRHRRRRRGAAGSRDRSCAGADSSRRPSTICISWSRCSAVTVPWSTLLQARLRRAGHRARRGAAAGARSGQRACRSSDSSARCSSGARSTWRAAWRSLSVLLTLAAGATILVSRRSLLAGFAALFMLLLGVAALTPARAALRCRRGGARCGALQPGGAPGLRRRGRIAQPYRGRHRGARHGAHRDDRRRHHGGELPRVAAQLARSRPCAPTST